MTISEEEEEVFAESYDDAHEDTNTGGKSSELMPNLAADKERDKIKFMVSISLYQNYCRKLFIVLSITSFLQGYPGCPNKWNVYHECQTWCLNTFGSGKSDPDPEYRAKFDSMMSKYGLQQLPDGWKEQYDPGVGRHYFWCTKTDRVSWLPPGHPKAKITDAASQVREMLQSQVVDEDEEDDDDEDEDQAMDLDSDVVRFLTVDFGPPNES